ncbi:MAG TPA: glycoside hydrolase family 2 TIM barrel-domain containing protein [Vicinamibacterales bacterium]|nr:glycoside hydrolase family 2 TIM barrel-domain containing protein [Vicinamibacterales bacterium]
MRTILLFTVLALTLSEMSSNAGPQSVKETAMLSLAGDWKYLPFEGTTNLGEPGVSDADWPVMRLPSNWFLKGKKEYPVAADLSPVSPGTLANPGDLPPPGPERGLDYSGTVWFRRHFTHAGGKGLAILRFEMVDYYADVYVNGHHAGHHEGSFQPFEFEVSRWLVAGDNVVAVKVAAPAQIVDWAEDFPVSWPKRQTQVKGVFGYHDTRPGGTSGRGQERGTGGIVGDVSLRSSSGVELVRAEVAPMDVTEQSATLQIDYVLHNWTGASRTGTLNGEIAPKNFASEKRDRFTQQVTLAPGENRVRVTRRVEQPALWWSWDYGKPNLYQLTSTLSGASTGNQQTTFGIRSIRRDDKWVWYLNGRRIFPRGSNYISTQWLSQADRQWYERDVDLMLKANLNSIRVHAHLERPEFYDVADERGLMVWQDFPLQWGYADLPSFHAEAKRQLGDMIGLFFNHPSIIVWSMHNESPHAMTWMKRKVQNQNLALDDALFADGSKRDPTRVAHRDSGTGDGHPYPGWYGGKVAEYAGLPGGPFITEYGAQAVPIPETMKSMMPADALWPMREDVWAFHNFQREHTFNTAKIPVGKTLDEFIWNSQNYQAAMLRFATEGYRRAKWTKITGLYQFMFVDDWPSITWSVVDYYRRPKRGFTTLSDSMQPTLPSIEYAIDNPGAPITLWVVNDRFEGFPGARLTWKIGGKEQSQTLDVPADGVVKASVIGAGTAIAAGSDTLEVRLEDRAGRVIGKNRLEAADFLFWKQ